MFEGPGIFVLVILAVVVFYLLRAIRMVPQGYNYTVERFGRYVRTLGPGLGLIVPFIDRIGAKMNMMERVIQVPSQEVITKDNAMVTVDGVAFYQVMDAPKATYEVVELENAIINMVMTNIRTVMGSMELDSLLSQRDDINHKLLGVVDQATNPWGVKMTRIEIKDINPPRDLVDSMGRQMKAEREKRASILEAEGLRQAAILKAEGEKQAVVLQAEGRREAAFRDAEARERSAEAEAKATELVSTAIANGNVQAINYFVANNYVKALEAIAQSPNQKILMMPLDATSILGSIGGIAEIAREAFGGGSTETPQAQGRIARSRRNPKTIGDITPCKTSFPLLEFGSGGLRPAFSCSWNFWRRAFSSCGSPSPLPPLALSIISSTCPGSLNCWPLPALRLSMFFSRRPWYSKGNLQNSDQPNLNQRIYAFVGKSFVLSEPIVNGQGKLDIEGTRWDVLGPDLAKGATVKVTAVEGMKLRVTEA